MSKARLWKDDGEREEELLLLTVVLRRVSGRVRGAGGEAGEGGGGVKARGHVSLTHLPSSEVPCESVVSSLDAFQPQKAALEAHAKSTSSAR